jgi:hypothetical protein
LWKAVAIKHARHNATIVLVLETVERTAGEKRAAMITRQEAELLVAAIAKTCEMVIPVEAALEAMYAVEQQKFDCIRKRGKNRPSGDVAAFLKAAE